MCALSHKNETWWCWTTCMALTVQSLCRDQDSLAVCKMLVLLSYVHALGFVQSCNYIWHQIGNCSSVLQFSMVKRKVSKQYKIRDGWSSQFLVPFGRKKKKAKYFLVWKYSFSVWEMKKICHCSVVRMFYILKWLQLMIHFVCCKFTMAETGWNYPYLYICIYLHSLEMFFPWGLELLFWPVIFIGLMVWIFNSVTNIWFLWFLPTWA